MLEKKQTWHYPEAIEHQGILYISLSHNGRNCWLVKIPVESLAVP